MFDNNNKIFAYKIALKLDPYLVALFNLCYDISIKLKNITTDQDNINYAVLLFSDLFYEKLGIKKDEYLEKDDNNNYSYTKELFFNTVATHLNSYYLRSEAFTSKLETKNFLYYLKDKFIVYSIIETKKEVRNHLNSQFKTINIIEDLINDLNDDRLKESIKSISTIYELNKSGQHIEVTSQENLKPQLLNLEIDLLNLGLLKIVDVDIENIWINYTNELNKTLNFDQDKDEYYIVKSNDNSVIGLKVNDHILLKYGVNFKKYIREECLDLYLWKLLKGKYFKKSPQTLSYDSRIIQNFKEKSQEENFNKLLCNLKHNLYIDSTVQIQSDYECFFEEFIIINKLDNLSNFSFFLPDENTEKDFLGIYTEQKIDKKYNLLHYWKHKDNEHTESFVNSQPIKNKKHKVHILKAELSFYLIEKYYEDLIEDLLKELKVDFVSNVELSIKGEKKAEFDFIIFKDNKFYFIEAKTTLSKDSIYETSKRYNNNIEYLKRITDTPLLNFSFILTGLLSTDNIDNYRHFFTDDTYNKKREGFAITPYKFNVPFFRHEGLDLKCIAEPEILKLKEYIKNICQI